MIILKPEYFQISGIDTDRRYLFLTKERGVRTNEEDNKDNCKEKNSEEDDRKKEVI